MISPAVAESHNRQVYMIDILSAQVDATHQNGAQTCCDVCKKTKGCAKWNFNGENTAVCSEVHHLFGSSWFWFTYLHAHASYIVSIRASLCAREHHSTHPPPTASLQEMATPLPASCTRRAPRARNGAVAALALFAAIPLGTLRELFWQP